jgi:hypothetical protein
VPFGSSIERSGTHTLLGAGGAGGSTGPGRVVESRRRSSVDPPGVVWIGGPLACAKIHSDSAGSASAAIVTSRR